MMDKVQDKWETNLELIGATAIEDRLQDEVRKYFIYLFDF
jgi:magnesium-transporting ATPase (P-type)